MFAPNEILARRLSNPEYRALVAAFEKGGKKTASKAHLAVLDWEAEVWGDESAAKLAAEFRASARAYRAAMARSLRAEKASR